MNKKFFPLFVLFGVLFSFLFGESAQAVIPPDFIFNIGAQLVQFFSIVIVFFAAILGTFFQFFKNQYLALKNRKSILAFVIIGVVAVIGVSGYWYAGYRQEVEYQKWLAESKKYQVTDDDFGGIGKSFEDVVVVPGVDEELPKDENDQLGFGKSEGSVDSSDERFVSKTKVDDDSAIFINTYYKYIALGNFSEAYEMSSKVVDLPTFSGWYENTNKIILDKLVRIDEKTSSIELTLYEGNTFTRYGVLMTLLFEDKVPVRIAKSEVKILFEGLVDSVDGGVVDAQPKDKETFFTKNVTEKLFVTNQEFQQIIDGTQEDYLVLDAREDIEYEHSYFPGSVHIRFADLKAGRWIELPQDKFIYVFCWSGMRGKEVAEFLRTKKMVALYLEGGAKGWFDFGGRWVGGISLWEKYEAERYQHVFETQEVREHASNGVVLVDSREPSKFQRRHINGSFNIPIMYTPTINMDETFGQIPVGSRVITICDSFINCFDAKLTGIELESRGHIFLGIYNKPWDYAN